MATSSQRREQMRRHSASLVPAVLIGVAAAALPLLAPAPAKAAILKCPDNTGTPPNVPSTDQPPTNLGVVTVNVDGIDYQLCSIYTSYDKSKDLLDATKWNLDPGASTAQKFANALQIAADGSNNKYSEITNGNYYKGINPSTQPNGSLEGPFFLWDAINGQLDAAAYNTNDSVNSNSKPTSDGFYWYIVNATDPPNGAPAPLPLLGAGAAFGWSRRLRRRLKGQPPEALPVGLTPPSVRAVISAQGCR